MSSEHREPSRIPPSGTYISTAALTNSNVYAGTINATTGNPDAYTPSPAIGAAGTILYDMGKTVYVYNTDKSMKAVLRKVQQAIVGGNGQTFYITIGSDSSVTASPVARL